MKDKIKIELPPIVPNVRSPFAEEGFATGKTRVITDKKKKQNKDACRKKVTEE